MADSIEVIDASSAGEFWGVLSPEKPLFPKPCKLLYRGQGNHRWNLTPGILRKKMSSTADMQVFKEWAYVESFVRHCDSIGLAIPNDSPAFREKFLNQSNLGDVSDWPPTEMHPLMALAQHYRLPTRLLDWSTRAYVAAYFAISDALAKKVDTGAERLAVWVLDIEKQALFHELKVVTVPGGNNANLAAQSGRFTLLTQKGGRAKPFEGETALDYKHGLRVVSGSAQLAAKSHEPGAGMKTVIAMKHSLSFLEIAEVAEGYTAEEVTKELSPDHSFDQIQIAAGILRTIKDSRITRLTGDASDFRTLAMDRERFSRAKPATRMSFSY